MTIDKTLQNGELTLALAGRLDTTTAPLLEEELDASLEGITSLVLDFGALEYISSAGLRVLLKTRKAMKPPQKMAVTHISQTIQEIFEATCFTDILTVMEK